MGRSIIPIYIFTGIVVRVVWVVKVNRKKETMKKTLADFTEAETEQEPKRVQYKDCAPQHAIRHILREQLISIRNDLVAMKTSPKIMANIEIGRAHV